MKYQILSRFGWAVVCAQLLVGRLVTADMAPFAEIQSLSQEGQDVNIKVGALGGGIAQLENAPIAIVRIQNEERTTIAEDIILSPENATTFDFHCGEIWSQSIDTAEFCGLYPSVCLDCPGLAEGRTCIGADCDTCYEVGEMLFPEMLPLPEGDDFCDTYPAYMVDCDDDGTDDCCLVCDGDYEFMFVDACVPPGRTEYLLEGDAVENYGDRTIDVVDAGVGCDAPSTDDTDSAIDTGSPDTESGQTTDEDDSEDTATGASTDAPEDTETETAPIPTTDDDTATETETGGNMTTDEPLDTDAPEDTATETESSGQAEHGDTATTEEKSSDPDTSDDTDSGADEGATGKSGGCSISAVGEKPSSGSNLESLFFLLR